MKTWNKPEMIEINISETKNGYWDHYYESRLIPVMNDSKKDPEENTQDPEPVEDLS